MAVDQTADAVQANAQYLAQGAAMVSVAQQIQQAMAGQLAVFGGMQQAVSDLSGAMQSLPGQLSDLSSALQLGSASGVDFLERTNQIVGSFADFDDAVKRVMSVKSIKDFSTKIGTAIQTVGPVAAGAFAVATVAVVGGIAGLIAAYNEGSKEADAYRKALVLTGNEVGTTVEQMQAMAASIDGVVGTHGKAAESLAIFASQNATGAATLEQYTQVAIGFERSIGQSVSETAKQFASLQGDPLNAVLKLNSGMNFLTESTYTQIKSLQEQGLVTEAAEAAQSAFAGALVDRTKEMEANLGSFERMWRKTKELVSEIWDSVKSIGREVGVESQYAAQQEIVGQLQAKVDDRRARGLATGDLDRQLNAASDRLADLNNQVVLNQTNAQLEAERAARVKARVEADKDGLKYLSGAERVQRQINAETEMIRRSYDGLTDEKSRKMMEAEIAAREKAIRESAAKPRSVQPSYGSGKELSEFDKVMKHLNEVPAKAAAAEAAQAGYTKSQAELKALMESPAWEKFTEKQRETIKVKYEAKILGEQEVELATRRAKADVDAAQSREKYITSLSGGIDKIQADIVAQEEANARMGMSKEAIATLEIAKIEMMAVDLELQAIKAMDRNLDEAAYALLIQQAEGYRALAQAKKDGAGKEKAQAADAQAKDAQTKAAAQSEDAAKKAQEQWKATADSINKSLTDAFMKSLESGKDFGKNLREALKEQFKSLVLKPTISAVMSPISGFFSSLVSGVSAGITGGTGGGGGGIGNLFSLGSAGYQAYTGQGLVGQGLSALSRSLGYGVMTSNMGTASVLTSTGAVSKAALDGTIALGSNAVPGAYAGMGSWGAGGIAGLIAMAVINAFGGMRSETMIGSGLRGTLDGKRTLDPWEEWREGGTILSGPEFSTGNPLELIKELRKKIDDYHALPDEVQNSPQSVTAWQTILAELERTHAGLEEQVNKQSKAINEGYNALRTNIVGMANSIGLAGDKIKDFAFVLETQDLNFQGLKPEEIQEKITKVMDKAGNSMAKELLGYMKPVTETITRTVAHGEGSMGEDRHVWYTQETETTTKMVYQASEYAKAGETVLETLTRLSTAFNALNDASNSLGFGLHEGSVALADFASGFIEAFGGLEQFSASTSLFLQNYYSDEERRQAMARTGAIRAQELGIDIDAEGILNLSKQDIRNAANSLVSDPAGYRKALDLANYLAPLYQVTEAVEQAVEPTQSLATAVDELTEKFNGAKEALLNDAKSLSVDLLRAQGKEGEAKALERQQYLDGFVDEHGNKLDEGRLQQLATQYDANAATRRAIDVQNERNGLQDELNALTDDATQALTRQRDALDESNRALFDNVQAIKLQKTIADELPGVVDKYLSPAQRRQSQYDKVTADLNAVGIKVSSEQLMGLSRAQIGSAAMDIYNTAGVPDEARLAVVRAAGALADLKNADVDTAFAALERAVDAQRKVLDEAITELTSVFETARDAAKTLFGQVESAVQFQGDEGRAFISNALAVAQSTGYLPESKEFSKAVSDATGALGQQMFATQAESDYQRLVLANELKGLQDISGDQLEKAKDELEYLDEQLAEQRKQIDVLNGIDLSVQSVAGAISALGTTMNGARSATTLGGSGLAAYDTELGVGRNAAGTLFQRDDIRLAASNALEAGANPRDIYNVIKGSGFTLAQAGVILGTEPGSLEDFAREMNWPVFHRGTRRVPRTGFALLQQGEAVIPAAYNPFAAGRGWGNSKDMLAAMEGVRAELIEVRRQNDALQRAAMRTADAVNGRPEAPMLVESV